jgi:hypothetical protein
MECPCMDRVVVSALIGEGFINGLTKSQWPRICALPARERPPAFVVSCEVLNHENGD